MFFLSHRMTHLEETKLLSSFVMTIMSNDSSYDCLFIVLPSLRSLVRSSCCCCCFLLFFVSIGDSLHLLLSINVVTEVEQSNRWMSTLVENFVNNSSKYFQLQSILQLNGRSDYSRRNWSNIRSSTVDSFGKDVSRFRSRARKGGVEVEVERSLTIIAADLIGTVEFDR